MSRAYRNSSDVPLDAIIKRLHELSDAVVGGRKTQAQEFVMRVPAECDHDADLVLAEAAVRLDALRKYNAELQAENDNLRKANQDCVAWEKACKADLDRALARVAELRHSLTELIQQYSETWDLPILQRAEAARDGATDTFILRKQAEVLERLMDGVGVHTHETVTGEGISTDEIWDYAQSLRQQADQMEADMGEVRRD